MTQARRLATSHAIGLAILHVGSVWALVATELTATALVVGLLAYQLKIVGVTVGFHRHFTHQSFEATRPTRFVLALLGTLAGQGPIKRWVFHHRDHHANADRPADPHSPHVSGFLHAHLGWLLQPESFDDGRFARYDLALDPEVAFLDRHFTPLVLFQAPALYALGQLVEGNGAGWVGTGFFLSATASLHATFLVNSLGHARGDRRFATRDHSRNNALVALLTNGEGWHNNHHHAPASARHGATPWQLDVSYGIIRLLQWVGLVRHVRVHRF